VCPRYERRYLSSRRVEGRRLAAPASPDLSAPAVHDRSAPPTRRQMSNRELAEYRSTMAVLSNMKRHTQLTNKLWAASKSAPMFSKQKTLGNGKKVCRTSRLIGGHAYKIALAGSVRSEIDKVRRELKRFGLTPADESKTQPYRMTISPGARQMFEQFMCALAQQGGVKAQAILQDANIHTRMQPTVVKLGYGQMIKSVFGETGPMARRVAVLPAPNKRAGPGKKKVVDEEFVPQEEEEEAAAEAEEEEEAVADAAEEE